MSAITTTSIRTGSHAKNLRNYIDGKEALLRDSQNIIDEKDWFGEMDTMRETFGHNTPARQGASNVIIHHQIIAFNPDECDVNGGKMTPEKCMEYAKEYIRRFYPDQQIALALHKEHCTADNTDRYAVHMAINRTNLETGNRLHEGTGAQSKFTHARQVKEMDQEYGLKQMERGKNSKTHSAKPGRGVEQKIVSQGKYSYKENLRDLVNEARNRSTDIEGFRSKLDEWGVSTEIKNGRIYATDRDEAKYNFRLDKLDERFTNDQLKKAFEINISKEAQRPQGQGLDGEMISAAHNASAYHDEKKSYFAKVDERVKQYGEKAASLHGTDFAKFPELKLPRVSDSLAKDTEVQQKVLSAIRQGKEWRTKHASNVPAPEKSAQEQMNNLNRDIQNPAQTQEQTHEQPHKGRSR